MTFVLQRQDLQLSPSDISFQDKISLEYSLLQEVGLISHGLLVARTRGRRVRKDLRSKSDVGARGGSAGSCVGEGRVRGSRSGLVDDMSEGFFPAPPPPPSSGTIGVARERRSCRPDSTHMHMLTNLTHQRHRPAGACLES
jgi:hypothetical protein